MFREKIKFRSSKRMLEYFSAAFQYMARGGHKISLTAVFILDFDSRILIFQGFLESAAKGHQPTEV